MYNDKLPSKCSSEKSLISKISIKSEHLFDMKKPRQASCEAHFLFRTYKFEKFKAKMNIAF